MKPLCFILILVALASSPALLAQSEPPTSAATVEELGRAIFAALQANSFESMKHLLPNEEDLLEVIDTIAGSEPIPEERLEAMRAQVPEIVQATQAKLAEEFAGIREPWREIDWSSATMKGVRIVVRNPDTYEEREIDDATLAEEGQRAADVHILFQSGEDVREVDLQDCMKASRGWLVMEKLRLLQ